LTGCGLVLKTRAGNHGGPGRQQRRDDRGARRSAAAVGRHPEPESLSEVGAGQWREHDELGVPGAGQHDALQAGGHPGAVGGELLQRLVEQPV